MAASTRRTSGLRKLGIYGFELTEGSHNFYALLEFDVTDLRKTLRKRRVAGAGGSLFAFFIKAIALCLKAYPDFNSMIDIRHMTSFDGVDISVPIEMRKDGEVFTKQLVIRGADEKSVAQISREIDECAASDDGSQSYLASPFMRRLVPVLPSSLVRLAFRAIARNHKLVAELSGTAFVTSVSMFSQVPGFVVPYIGRPKASSFAIGSVVRKPVVVRDRIEIREIAQVTAIFNHDIVDGAPAARFINELRRTVESRFEGAMGDSDSSEKPRA